MKISKKEWSKGGVMGRKVAICAVSAAVAVMCVPANAFAYNGEPTAGNQYGCATANAITDPATGATTAPVVGTDSLMDGTTADGQTYVTAACGGSGTAIIDYADIVGLDNIASSNYNWGTRININPDHFAWNDILYTDENDVTTKSLSGDATDPSLGLGFVKSGPNGVMTYATIDKYRPDVLCNADLTAYKTIVRAINDADGNSSYSPQYATISTNTLITQVDSLWAEATAAKTVMNADSTKTTRYEDPYTIAENFENLMLGMQWYILSQHEQDNSLAKIAYITGYSDGTITAVAVDPTSETTSPGRQYEGFEQITNNVVLNNDAWTVSGTSATSTDLSSLLGCDVIFVNISSGQQGGGPGGTREAADDFYNALDTAGYTGKVCKSPSLSVGNQGFGFSRNLLEYMGYLYPEDTNLAYMVKYWWSKFGHVKDEYIDAVMVATESDKLLPTGNADTDLNTTGYSEDYMNARFAEGISYYAEHSEDANSRCSDYRLNAEGTNSAVNHYKAAATYSLANAKVSVNYDGVPTVTAQGITLTEGTDYYYTTSGKTVTVKGLNGYKGSISGTIPAAKAQTIKVKVSKKTYKAKKLKKKAASFKIGASAKTKLTYKVTKKASKKISVSKTGKVTLKKGAKKGTYKVTVYAAASKVYKAAKKVITIKVK